MEVFWMIFVIVLGYFVGNISFARIISKTQHDDITKKGSGNPGMMNVLRNYGAKLAVITLVLDVLKGVIPSLTAYLVFGGSAGAPMSTIALYSAGLSAIVGHIFPVFYKFKGGKGIACAMGVFLVANPLWLLAFFAVAFVYVWFFDYGSVGSLIIITAMTVIEGSNAINKGNITISLLLFAIFCLTWFVHRGNIKRLLIGKENKANLQKALRKKRKIENKQIALEEKQFKISVKSEKLELKQEKLEKKQDKLTQKQAKLEQKYDNIDESLTDLIAKN